MMIDDIYIYIYIRDLSLSLSLHYVGGGEGGALSRDI